MNPDEQLRPAEQCEGCAHSLYDRHAAVGVCRAQANGLCRELNPDNDCKLFENAQIRTRCVESADALTTEEMVALAEYCGYSVRVFDDGQTFLHVGANGERWGEREKPWNLVKDANQRDELAAMLLSDGWEVIQSTCPGDEWPYECELNKDQETQARLGVAKTPGLALCRPTLEMLKGKGRNDE